MMNRKDSVPMDILDQMILGLKQQDSLAPLQEKFYPSLKQTPEQAYYKPSKLQIQYRTVKGSDQPLFKVK